MHLYGTNWQWINFFFSLLALIFVSIILYYFLYIWLTSMLHMAGLQVPLIPHQTVHSSSTGPCSSVSSHKELQLKFHRPCPLIVLIKHYHNGFSPAVSLQFKEAIATGITNLKIFDVWTSLNEWQNIFSKRKRMQSTIFYQSCSACLLDSSLVTCPFQPR